MENRESRNPTGPETDISKAQSAQQPQGQAGQQPESEEQRNPQFGEANQAEFDEQRQQAEFGEDRGAGSPDEGLQAETVTQQRTDIEGASLGSQESEGPEGGFVGSKSERDASGLIEEEDFKKDDQGAPEGK